MDIAKYRKTKNLINILQIHDSCKSVKKKKRKCRKQGEEDKKWPYIDKKLKKKIQT